MFLIDDLFKGIGRKKQLSEQNKANQAGFQARKTQFGQMQGRRSTRLGAVQQFLQALQGSLPSGAPSYQFDPGTLTELQKPVDYAEAAPADVSKGAGWSMAGDLVGGVGQGLAQAYMGGLFGGGGATGAGSTGLTPGGQYDPFKTGMRTTFNAPTLH